MKKSLLIFLASLLLQACTSPIEPAPADLISEKKMTTILVDIHIAESRIENMGLPYDTGAIYYQKLQLEVLKKHQVSLQKFTKSYDYYITNVSELDKIYEKVVDSLSVKEVEASATPVAPPVAQ